MLPQLTATEAESMDPQVYASLVSGEDYAEYAERTECDNRAFNERLSNCRTGKLIDLSFRESIAVGEGMNDLKRFLFYGKSLPLQSQTWWESGRARALARARCPVAIGSETDKRLAAALNNPIIQRLLHVGAGLQTEASEFNQALYDHLFHEKPLDMVNLAEELGDSCWYIGIGCRALGITLAALLRNNIAKLFKRFRGKFCYDRVGNRDLAGERAVLEDLK